MENIDTLETYDNPKGIIAISSYLTSTVVAYPEKNKGIIAIKIYDKKMRTAVIQAHSSTIACISLNFEGTLVATASSKGTLIRIFNVAANTPIQELRRGIDKAEIYSISFDVTSQFISCSSDRGTVHIFCINNPPNKENKNQIETKNSTHIFSKINNLLKGMKEKMDTESSFAQFRIPDLNSICIFGIENTIFVITFEGKYYHATFDSLLGGNCTKSHEYHLNLGI